MKPFMSAQTWKMSEILPEHDYSFPIFTRKAVKFASFTIVTKQRKLGAWVNLPSLGKVTQPGEPYPA